MLWKLWISTLVEEARSSLLIIAARVKGHFTASRTIKMQAQTAKPKSAQRSQLFRIFFVLLISGGAIAADIDEWIRCSLRLAHHQQLSFFVSWMQMALGYMRSNADLAPEDCRR